MDTDWLTLLCAAALAFSVMNYVVLDGTDLGVGMLMGLTDCKHQRRAMAVSILPVWDANETWLVLGGGGLLALFPLAYAILLPALYVPFIVMFLALIARAMALEFRGLRTERATQAHRRRCAGPGFAADRVGPGHGARHSRARRCASGRSIH
ncbi:cytochrome d ubiquinol oxidase subunit II [Pseudomonas sp. S2_A05]